MNKAEDGANLCVCFTCKFENKISNSAGSWVASGSNKPKWPPNSLSKRLAKGKEKNINKL